MRPTLFLLLLYFIPQVQAQIEAASSFTLRARRIDEAIKIDGKLDEPIWSTAERLETFYQREPVEGNPASEKTEVSVVYDTKYIYIGVHAYDSEPHKLNARELSRDSNFGNDDKIDILLDTYGDRRNAFLFTVNPLGTQCDQLITDDGRQSNVSWDGLWFSEAHRNDKGYSVEIAVPLTTLRYAEGLDSWGFNVSRTIRRKNEEVLAASWKRTLGLLRISQAGQLTGLSEIKRPRLFDIKPYVAGGVRQNVQDGRGEIRSGLFVGAGIEVARIGLTPSLTAEITINPDFGQAEVDTQVVNFTRFSVFFPERREFFLENIGFFNFGRIAVNQMFFSRRIGLTEDGRPLPIDYGVKLTGKIGRYNVGILQVQTRRIAGLLPEQHYTVARVRRDIFKSSSVGAIFVNRQGGRYNRGYGIDTQLDLSKFWRISGFLAATATPGVKSDSFTGRISSDYRDNYFSLTAVYEEIGRNFNPELGFTFRKDVKQLFTFTAYRLRPRMFSIREIEIGGLLEYYALRSNNKLSTRTVTCFIAADFNNSSSVSWQPFSQVTDVLLRPFRLRPDVVIPVGSYTFQRSRLEYSSNQSKPFIFRGLYESGGYYSGSRREIAVGFTYRINEHILISMDERYNLVTLPQAKFSTSLYGLRTTFNLSRKTLISSFLQLNSAARLTSLNFRLRYIYRPNSDLYVIYNQNTGKGLQQQSYQLQFKTTIYFKR
ncbi:MAG: DUF5916 domain-containing protein [Acidobacteriota bacterium]|nr:carbohydrate binding family 9 domain-containing protein [Blastocatellia bacterium]MDW8411251.1 DUF5916 domain-containing protein [Acidobacteriota bacterium]